MAYMTIPNSFTTANTVLADALQENYEVITTNIMCGTVDINVANFTADATTVSGNVSCTSINIQGLDKGTRHLIPLCVLYAGSSARSGSGYLELFDYPAQSLTVGSNVYAVRLPTSGSVTGYGLQAFSDVNIGNTFVVGIEVSGTTIATHEFVYSDNVLPDVAHNVFARGTYVFSAGAKAGVYWTEVTSAAGGEIGLNISLEVVYD